jgi:hypothetical protein
MPDTPPLPPGIDEKIAEAVANEDYELAARLKKTKESPPPPPKKGKAPPPPPPKKGKAPPPPPPKKGKAPPPPPPKKGKAPPSKKTPPKGKAPPPKSKPKASPPKKTPPKGKPKRRRRRLKLRMKSKEIATEEDSYTDTVGWNAAMGTVLEEETEVVEEPKTITHQCSMCGSLMTIPKPKRERYRIVCSYPMCGHADSVGF